MQILLSNDDGISSPGLVALEKKFKKWGKVFTVAPAFNQSTSGHALSLHRPLRMEQLSKNTYAVNGTPADCVHLALTTDVFGKQRPDLIVSGINQGANLGQDVFYSGTVAAAREAALSGIPAFAVSLVCRQDPQKRKIKFQYSCAAQIVEKVAKKIFVSMGNGSQSRGMKNWPRGLVINVNVPNLPYREIKGICFAKQGRQIYGGKAIRRKDSRGQPYYWIGGTHQGFAKQKETDCDVVSRKYVAVTPLSIDCTHYDFIQEHLTALK